MILIDPGGAGRIRVCLHARYLVRREAVCLEIRKAPVGIAEIRARGSCTPIRIDGLRLAPERLQSMADGQVYVGRLRTLLGQLTIDRQCLLVPPEAHPG